MKNKPGDCRANDVLYGNCKAATNHQTQARVRKCDPWPYPCSRNWCPSEFGIAMEPGAAMVMVPPVSLLTLGENCVKHAAPQTGELKVQIRVRMLEADGQSTRY